MKLCKNESLGPEGSPVLADDVLRDVGDSVTYGKANSQSGSEMNDKSHKFQWLLLSYLTDSKQITSLQFKRSLNDG